MFLKALAVLCAFLLGFYVNSQYKEYGQQKQIEPPKEQQTIAWEDPKLAQLVIYVPEESKETLELLDLLLKFLFLKDLNKENKK